MVSKLVPGWPETVWGLGATHRQAVHVRVSRHETLVGIGAWLAELPFGQAVAAVPRESLRLAVADPVQAVLVGAEAVGRRPASSFRISGQSSSDDESEKQE